MENKLTTIFDDFLANEDNLIARGGYVTVHDLNLIMKVINGTEGNFMVFENAGGKPFTIWEMEPKHIKAMAKDKSRQHHIFGYRIGKVDTVIKKIPHNKIF